MPYRCPNTCHGIVAAPYHPRQWRLLFTYTRANHSLRCQFNVCCCMAQLLIIDKHNTPSLLGAPGTLLKSAASLPHECSARHRSAGGKQCKELKGASAHEIVAILVFSTGGIKLGEGRL